MRLPTMFSVWRYHSHTGRWDGIAENANMNLTAGRCHNIVTQAFKSQKELKRSEKAENTNDGRRVSLPSYRTLLVTFPPGHPLALNPAMESETIRFVGYIGDPWIHRELRRECYRRTGVLGQLIEVAAQRQPVHGAQQRGRIGDVRGPGLQEGGQPVA